MTHNARDAVDSYVTHRLNSRGYVPNSGFEESPNTIDISTGFHHLDTTTKSDTSQSTSTPPKNTPGDERHVTHKICAVITLSWKEIRHTSMRAHVKYFNHLVISTTAFSLKFLSDLWTVSSKQPTSCLIRFATMISYSIIAANEKARFHGLRCCVHDPSFSVRSARCLMRFN